MEVKGILDKIRQPDEEKKEYFFALEIGLRVVKSAVWLVEKDQVKIAAIGSNENWQEEKDLLRAVDASLSAAAEKFAPDEEMVELENAIFGLPANWVREEKILPDKLQVLKHISQKLELKPVGFVVTNEAIAYYLKTIEGVPPTAILTALGQNQIALTLLRLGKVVGTQLVERSQSLGEDVIEGLFRFGEQEAFPARIMLYDGDEAIEEARQALVDFPWQEAGRKDKGVAFLHLPKVEVLSPDFDIKAVALAGGKEVAKAAGLSADFQKAEAKTSPKPTETKPAREGDQALAKTDFGFVKDKDIAAEKEPAPARQPAAPVEPASQSPAVPAKASLKSASPLSRFNLGEKFKSFFAGLKKINFNQLSRFFPQFKANQNRLVLAIVVVFLLVLGGGLLALYWYLPSASVVLLVEPEVLEEEFEVRLDPALGTANLDDLALPAEEVSQTVEGQKTIAATGTKITGEKATGEVTIFNGTPEEKTFTAGTSLTSASEIEFNLSEEVTVPAQSSAADPPGKATVGVTAAEVGNEGNLAADTEFVIGTFSRSDFVAKNESAFTGGTSREIQVVAEEDHETLLASLTETLESEAADQIRAHVPLQKKLIEESIEGSVAGKTFSRAVEEEATEVSLDLKSEFKALVYSEEEMRTLVVQMIEDKIPAGFEFQKEESEMDFELEELLRTGGAIFTVRLAADLVPQIDLEEIRTNLAGKYPTLGKTYLENLPNVVATEIKIKPRLPNRLLTFPRVAQKINIEVKVQ